MLFRAASVRGRLTDVDSTTATYVGMIDGPAEATLEGIRSSSRNWGDARPQFTALDFQGVPERLDPGRTDFELARLEAGRRGQLVAFQIGEPLRFGWSREVVPGA